MLLRIVHSLRMPCHDGFSPDAPLARRRDTARRSAIRDAMLLARRPAAASTLDRHRAVAADLEELAESMPGRERELRTAVAQRLKAALAEGRAGRRAAAAEGPPRPRTAPSGCASCRTRSSASLFEFAGKHLYPSDNPSEAERMAVVATGGYGRGLLAPGSDIDLLFLLPYKQTAWGESVAEADPLLPLGHGPEGRPRHALGRRMHPPGQGGHDDPHRACSKRASCSATASCSTN